MMQGGLGQGFEDKDLACHCWGVVWVIILVFPSFFHGDQQFMTQVLAK
jgi:hypothetical protein